MYFIIEGFDKTDLFDMSNRLQTRLACCTRHYSALITLHYSTKAKTFRDAGVTQHEEFHWTIYVLKKIKRVRQNGHEVLRQDARRVKGLGVKKERSCPAWGVRISGVASGFYAQTPGVRLAPNGYYKCL